MGALCPDHLGGEKSKEDAVFLSCRAGYFLCKLTDHSSLRESMFIRIHGRPSQRGALGLSSTSALCTGAFSHISNILQRLPEANPRPSYFWLNTVGCHHHLHACSCISTSKLYQHIASLSPIILHSGLLTFGSEEEGLFCPGCNRRQIY